MAKLTVKVSGTMANFKRAMADLQRTDLKVGWFESAKYADKDETPVAYVAALNELGPHARPFMKPTAEKEGQEWAHVMGSVAQRVILGKMSVEQALDTLGLVVTGDISKTIATIWEPPLSLITLMARKWQRDHNWAPMTGTLIGQFAAEIKRRGDAAVRADLNLPISSQKPLNNTGHMLATLTHAVEKK